MPGAVGGVVTSELASAARPASGGLPLRLLMTTPVYVPHIGGVERQVHMLSCRLAELGVSVTVLTTDPTRALPERELLDGVEVLRVRAWPRGGDYRFAPQIYATVRRGNWDLVHVQCYQSLVAPLAMLGASRAGVPYVVTFHGGGVWSWLRRRQWTVLRRLLAGAERLVATAPFEVDLYRAALGLPPERFVFIPVGVDFGSYDLERASSERVDPLIASVGRLVRSKGHHRLIGALPEIVRARPDVRVWIAGAGPWEKELWAQAQRLGVAHRIEIRAIPGDDARAMAAELAKAALVVLFSDGETMPSAVLEALALRRPVLVTHSQGLSQFADAGLARSVPADSGPEGIAAAVLEQLENPFVPQHVDLPGWKDVAGRHLDMYTAVLGAARAAGV